MIKGIGIPSLDFCLRRPNTFNVLGHVAWKIFARIGTLLAFAESSIDEYCIALLGTFLLLHADQLVLYRRRFGSGVLFAYFLIDFHLIFLSRRIVRVLILHTTLYHLVKK